jgi:hypothetical protein
LPGSLDAHHCRLRTHLNLGWRSDPPPLLLQFKIFLCLRVAFCVSVATRNSNFSTLHLAPLRRLSHSLATTPNGKCHIRRAEFCTSCIQCKPFGLPRRSRIFSYELDLASQEALS